MEDCYLWITWLCRQPVTKPEVPQHSCSWTSHTSRSPSHQGKLKGYANSDIYKITLSLSIGRTQLVSDIMVMVQAVTLICSAIMEAWCAITREKTKQLGTSTKVSALVACRKLSTHKTQDQCTMRLKIGSPPRLSASSKSASCSNYLLQTDSPHLKIRLDRNKMEPWV